MAGKAWTNEGRETSNGINHRDNILVEAIRSSEAPSRLQIVRDQSD